MPCSGSLVAPWLRSPSASSFAWATWCSATTSQRQRSMTSRGPCLTASWPSGLSVWCSTSTMARRTPCDLTPTTRSGQPWQSLPSLLEVMGHSYFFGGFLVGPQFPMKRYLDFVQGTFLTEEGREAILHSAGPDADGIGPALPALQPAGLPLARREVHASPTST
uniref:Lysophospholipid acyltransferase 5 n=1 Tax=Ixodes ricinus TaxID=34613 RepID=V5H9G2_IXORI